MIVSTIPEFRSVPQMVIASDNSPLISNDTLISHFLFLSHFGLNQGYFPNQ